MKRSLLQRFGILGVISLISYTAAVIFAPLAYPGYNPLAQAVSDLSAENAPSLALWNQLSCLYGVCGIVSVMAVCAFVSGKFSKTLRVGIYLFAAMNWVSGVGYSLFPLSQSGKDLGGFQNIMHVYVVTVAVVLLSVASLILITIGARKSHRALSILSLTAFILMLLGALGTNILPKEYFGIPERFSVFAATGFNAVLGIYLFLGFPKSVSKKETVSTK